MEMDMVSSGSEDAPHDDGSVSVPSFLFEPVDLQFDLADMIRDRGGVAPVIDNVANRNNEANSVSSLEWSALEDSTTESMSNSSGDLSSNEQEQQRHNTINDIHDNEDSSKSNSTSNDDWMWTGVEKENSPEQIATREFIRATGMTAVRDINDVGQVMDVDGDGNCGVYVLVLGLFHLCLPPYYLAFVTDRQRMEHIREKLLSPWETRREMYLFLKENVAYFNSKDDSIRRVHDACGNQYRDFRASSQKLLREKGHVGRRMYTPFVSYLPHAGVDHWLDINHHLPLAALKYRCTVVCYYVLVGSRHDTVVAHYNGGQVNMYFIEGDYFTPPIDTPVICLNYINGNHFQYVCPHTYEGKVTRWEDIFNDDDDSLDDASAPDDENASYGASDDDDDDQDHGAIGILSSKDDDNSMLSSKDDDKADAAISVFSSDDEDGFNGCNFSSKEKFLETSAKGHFGHKAQLEEASVDVEAERTSRSVDKSITPHPHLKKSSSRKVIDLCDSEDDARGPTSDKVKKPSPSMLHGVSDVVGRRPNISQYRNFQKITKSNGKTFVKYKPFKKDNILKVKVPSSEFAGKLMIKCNDKGLEKVKFCPGWTDRAPWFRSTMRSVLPKHVCLVGKNSTCLDVPKKRSDNYGKKATHTNLVKFDGVCSGGKYKKRGCTENSCSTKWVGGIDAANVMKLHRDPFDSLIEVQIQLWGQCIHEEGKTIGQLRGKEREEMVKEVMQSKLTPKEFAIDKLVKADPETLVTKNRDSMPTSPLQIYNLKREGMKKQAAEKGICASGSDVTNILNVISRTRKMDIEAREKLGDYTTDLLGIARTVSFFPLNVILHAKPALYLAGHLSDNDRLVMSLDATGGMLNVRNTEVDGKIQHTFLNIQATECVLDKETAMEYSRDTFSPLQVSQRVARHHTAEVISEWLVTVKNDVEATMSSIQGSKRKAQPFRPIAVKMDCALELLDGCLTAFRQQHHVRFSAAYSNSVVLVMLWYEGRISDATTDERRLIATECYEALMRVAPSIFKQCKAHVFRALDNYPRNNKSDLPVEMRLWNTPFQILFSRMATEMTEVGSVSQVIARISVVVSILLRKNIRCCGVFDRRTEVKSRHSGLVAQSHAIVMDKVIREQAERIQIEERETFEELLKKEIETEAKMGKQNKFSAHHIAQRVIDVMLGKGQGLKSLPVADTYLSAKTKRGKEGTVAIVYIHSPYGKDEEGREIIVPQLLWGVSVKVKLPHKAGVVPNPLHSPMAAKYLLKNWLSRIGLWSQSSTDMLNLARDCRTFPDNNSMEGFIKHQKYGNATISEDLSDFPSYISKSWHNSVGDGKLFAEQCDSAPHVVDRRRDRRMKKVESEKTKKDDNDCGDMMWKKTPGSVRGVLKNQKEKMLRALEAGMSLGDFEYTEKNMSAMCRIMRAHAETLDMNFMKNDTFRAWFRGERRKELKKHWVKIIDDFHDKYVGN